VAVETCYFVNWYQILGTTLTVRVTYVTGHVTNIEDSIFDKNCIVNDCAYPTVVLSVPGPPAVIERLSLSWSHSLCWHRCHYCSALSLAALAEGSRADCIQTISSRAQVCTRVRTCIPYWRGLSVGRCGGSSATPFQFILIIDCQPHPTSYCLWPSFPGRRCTCLEQSARSCHFSTFRSSRPVPAWNSTVFISYPFPLWLFRACAVTLAAFGHNNRSCLLAIFLPGSHTFYTRMTSRDVYPVYKFK